MANLPTGTVTFLFSDVEGSTALLKRLGDTAYADLLAMHRRLVRETFAAFGGREIDTQGDAFFYSFTRARDAVGAAIEVQRAHAKARWPGEASVRLRIGLHTGEPAVGDEGYTGLDVVRASRIAATGRGGQVLLSDATRAIIGDDLPEGVVVRPLGRRQLRDIDRPEPLSELAIPGVEVSEPHVEPAGRDEAPRSDRPGTGGRFGNEAGIPGLAEALTAARQWIPGGEAAQRLIEERVLASLTGAFDESDARRRERSGGGRETEPQRRASGSVSDEIQQLRTLRDDGALTEEQYRRAVDRVIGGES